MSERDRHAVGVTIVAIIGTLFVSTIVFLTVAIPEFRIIVAGFGISGLLALGLHMAGWDEEDY